MDDEEVSHSSGWGAVPSGQLDIAVIGSGSLARALCYSMATVLEGPVSVLVAARSYARSTELCFVAGVRATARSEDLRFFNVTGFVAALLLGKVIRAAPVYISLPGPMGLSGGYPVKVTGRDIEVWLPAGISMADAIAWNKCARRHDGAWVSAAGRICFSASAERELRRHSRVPAADVPVESIDEFIAQMLDLRHRLRSRPSEGQIDRR